MGEHIDTINQRLRDFYGIDLDSSNQRYRIVWSDDQYEKRRGDFNHIDSNGQFQKLVSGVCLVPKYKYLPHQWVLERLYDVPEGTELIEKKSYEPVWAFGDKDPREYWDAVKVLVDVIVENIFKGKERVHQNNQLAKYKEDQSQWNTKEAIKQRVEALKKVLYQDETPLADAIHFGEGISVPNKEFGKEAEQPLITES